MITVENLSKSFQHNANTVVALDDVSLEVPAGAVYGVVGASGAGKTTLARCLALQERPDRGAIRIDGTDLVALDGTAKRAARRQIGVVPHGDSLVQERTVAGNVAVPLESAGVSGPQRRSRVAELLDLVGLADKAPRYLDQLSDGQRRRVAIARALAPKPSVLLADDPTASLEPAATDSLVTVLDRARAELGVTVVVATGDMAAVRRIADDVAVLDGGRVVEHGSVLDLVAEPGSKIGSALLPDTDLDDPRKSGGRFDVVAEIVLVGFAAVGALLPEAGGRFGVDVAVLGGGLTRIGETPVAKFKIGMTGERSEAALKWMIERDAHVRRTPVCLDRVA